jgi:hypothetical protein
MRLTRGAIATGHRIDTAERALAVTMHPYQLFGLTAEKTARDFLCRRWRFTTFIKGRFIRIGHEIDPSLFPAD